MVPFLLDFRWGLKAGAMGDVSGATSVVTGQAAGGWLTLTQGFLEYFVFLVWLVSVNDSQNQPW